MVRLPHENILTTNISQSMVVVTLRMSRHTQCHYFVQSLPESVVSSYHSNLCLQVLVQGSVTYVMHKYAHMFRRNKTAYMRKELKGCEKE